MTAPAFSLRQQAYTRIRELLRNRDLRPGVRVSSLELSRRLGISRTPVREALSRLCSDGVMREVPGVGVCVHVPDEAELIELYGMREVLETYATREAAQHISERELVQLEELLIQWKAIAHHLRDSGAEQLDARLQERWIRIDQKFHHLLLEAARNRLLYKTVDDMRLTSRTLELPGDDAGMNVTLAAAARTYLDHMRLFRALKRHDTKAAEFWMRQQLRIGKAGLLAQLCKRKSASTSVP